MTLFTNPQVHNISLVPSKEDRDMATRNIHVYRKVGEIWMCGFLDMRADIQTNKQTYRHIDTLITVLGIPGRINKTTYFVGCGEKFVFLVRGVQYSSACCLRVASTNRQRRNSPAGPVDLQVPYYVRRHSSVESARAP